MAKTTRAVDDRTLRRGAIAAAWMAACILWPEPARALDPLTRLEDYQHTIWTARDGAPTQINAIMQTADGWIWLVTATNLVRFDGVRFETVQLPGRDLSGRGRLSNIYPGPQGELWLNYAASGGFSIVHADGSLEDLVPQYGNFGLVHQFATGPGDTRWAATENGLRYVRGKTLHEVDTAAGLPVEETGSMLFDPDGSLWVVSEHAVHVRKPGAARFEKRADVHGHASLIRRPNGEIWLAWQSEDRVELLSSPGTAPPREGTRSARESHPNSLFDRDGNLWTASCPGRLCLTRAADIGARTLLHPAADTAQRRQPGSSKEQPVAIMEDQAGSIWVATSSSIERYRNSRVEAVRFPGDTMVSMARDPDGRVWSADLASATAWRLMPGSALPDRTHAVQMVANAGNGAFLLAGKRELERRDGKRVENIALPPRRDGIVADLDVLGLQDDGRVIWMYAKQTGLMGYVDGRWMPSAAFNLPHDIMLSNPVGGGKIWFATSDGKLSLYDNGKYASIDASMIGAATNIDAGANVVISGDHGMAVLRDGVFVKLTARDPEVLKNVSGIAVTSNGDRWLNGGMGVVHVPAADWRASMADAGTPLRYELIDALDGYTGRAALENRLPSAYADKDDQLWFGTTEGVFHLDARKAKPPALPPVVAISALSNDGADVALSSRPVLPPSPHNVNILYAAPGAGKPERLRYQYRLAGEEARWQDAGVRRTAFYTDLAPGAHRFEVRAGTVDGDWTSAPSTLAFYVTPTLMQTVWFRCMLAALCAALLYMLYRWRLHTVAGQFRARLDERIDERNRIARELHDTLLQSVQGLLLKVHGAAVRLPPGEPVRGMLETALNQAEDTVGEARKRVRDLRGDVDGDGLSLATLLRAVGKELETEAGPAFALDVRGAERSLYGEAANECFSIGREALINAFRHAAARNIAVTITFSRRALELLVTDDGSGIPPDVAAPGGRAGHWGLATMRERAHKLHGSLHVRSAPGAGTRIALTIPAARAYCADARGGRWWRLPF